MASTESSQVLSASQSPNLDDSQLIMSDYTRDLNNHLQATGQVQGLTWQFSAQGPPHATIHTAIAMLYGLEIGRGTGTSRGNAKKVASQQALATLNAA
ncbi:hypothetical protein FA95DRAFT_1680692 [Auriscalpium vulgare]|uniref:Uncharacterized protein n=1 Tax=Auriscalpium vulgare TaxID=40419 RepID=A0ACB8RMV0_9AGAM|nr:hypothetical protein FA95DRAFT_1680692 [Auriscalpium vulgare]